MAPDTLELAVCHPYSKKERDHIAMSRMGLNRIRHTKK